MNDGSHWVRLLEDFRKVRRYVRFLGARNGLATFVREAMNAASQEVTMVHPHLSRSVVLRTHGSDISIFGKVIAEQEYNLEEVSNARTIVDAGAHVGLASVFFAEKFPNAKIIALEPESSNFELLYGNLKSYPNVICINKALWSQSGTVTVFDPGDGSWAFRIVSSGDDSLENGTRLAAVDCISIPELMAEYGMSRIDLLKVDIEGSEKEVFETSLLWIDRVDAIVIELHDRFKRGCSKAFYNATASFAIERHMGENVFVFRRPAVGPRGVSPDQ